MDAEAWLVILLLVGVTLPLTLLALRARPASDRRAALAAWTVGVALVAWLSVSYAPPERARRPVTDRPIEVAHAGYVSSRACKSCHPAQYATWHRSYHRTMTQKASADIIAGPIDGTVVLSRGQSFVLERRGDEVWVEMDDPAWTGAAGSAPRVWKEIVQTTGSHSEQFYWVSSGESRKLTLLPIMYRRLDEQRWTSLDGCCVTVPGGIQEVENGRWNRVCNRCHATHALPGIDTDEGVMDTRVAELGIACEACHGPAGDHVAANRDPRARYARHLAPDEGEGADPIAAASELAADLAELAPGGSIVNPSKLSKERSSEACGQCHGINGFHDEPSRVEWREQGFRYRPGDVLAESRLLETTGDDKFWSDGMVRVSGREYNGLVRTPCFTDGDMSCLSCHVMHKPADDPRSLDEWANDQLEVGMDGDLACTQCHDEYVGAEAIAAHTHHAPGTAGSACMNCHMPYTTYGLLKGIRSHQVSNPSAQESVATGRPNACNQCHLDRTLAWAAESLDRWYGIAQPDLGPDERSIAAGVLWSLQGDAGQRALMAWTMGWEPARAASGSGWMTPYLTVLMRDPYHAVRYIAHRSMQLQPEAPRIRGIDPLATPEELAKLTEPAYQAWLALQRSERPELLIGGDGDLELPRLDALLAGRNERPVTLNE